VPNKSIQDDELVQEIRHKFLTTLKGTYWHFFEEGSCFPETVIMLSESADRAIDHEQTPIQDLEFVLNYIKTDLFTRSMKHL